MNEPIQELFEKLRYIPSGLGCMDEGCEGCAYEEKERKEVEEQIVALVRKEERQFILNILDGIDIADKEMGVIGGTQAIRQALESRI